jgi:probable rRNA maturation factor
MWAGGSPPRALAGAGLEGALERFLRELGFRRAGLTVRLAGDAALRRLNARHRGVDAPTDILSWSYLEARPRRGGEPPLLGELAVSLARARHQARENGWDVRTELLRLLAHGCAHLAGYTHRTRAEDRRMRAVEERLLARVALRGLYPAPAAPRPARATGRRARANPRASAARD